MELNSRKNLLPFCSYHFVQYHFDRILDVNRKREIQFSVRTMKTGSISLAVGVQINFFVIFIKQIT